MCDTAFRQLQKIFNRKRTSPSQKKAEPSQTISTQSQTKMAPIQSKLVSGVNDITAPIALTPPGSQFTRAQHPVQPIGFSGVDLQNPIETNKWWGTIPLPGTNPTPQQGNVFSFPYTLWWTNTNPSGMNIQHVEASQIVFDTANTPPEYYLNPLGNISWNMGASEFNDAMQLALDTPTQFTINVTMSPQSRSGSIKMTLVEGMAFITGIYNGLTPLLQTVGRAILSFQSFTLASGIKYKLGLNDGTTWLVYGFPSSGSFSLSQNGATLVSSSPFTGVIQIAKIPIDDTTSEALYDANSGTYVTGMQLFGSTSGSTGTYGYTYTAAGKSNSVLHFAFPHHQASFDATTQSGATGLYLQSTTMGKMRAYTGSQWTMTETLPTDFLFLSGGTGTTPISPVALSAIQAAAEADISYNVAQTASAGSQYYAGKWMAKYAEICLVAHDVLQNPTLTATGVANLKAAFATFANNQQTPPLCYDTTWKGLISTAGLATAASPTGNSGVDFGNTWYDDHHFHYGYMVYAAALLGHLDPTWLTPSNIDYINSLVRDVANPSSQDPYFPVFRMFDWFVGHSWAEGLFFSGDGKNEESSSEDYNFSYGMKLWGLVTNNASMQGCGDLMLAVQRRYHPHASTNNIRAMNLYMLMSPNNTIQPAQFVPNYVTGILYMNKADHTTFFGTNLEYIQGIHMIPLTAISPFIRQPSFVATEWEAKLSAIIGNVDSGWKGILMANLAISDAQTAWTFFTVGFQGAAWLDDGASLTWYLAFVAGLLAGGNPLPPLQAPTPTPATSAPPTTSVPPVTPAPTTPAPTTPAPATTPTPAPATASAWNPTQFYQVGATVSYDGHNYECTIAHQAEATWTPTAAVSLWREIS